MRKIFIDGGANEGQSVRSFIHNHSDWSDYEMHSFECNPNLINKLKNYEQYTTIHQNALWVLDEELKFYLNGDGNTDGGTLRTDKTTGKIQLNKPTIVDGIDIVKFIKSNFKESDYIILKLDVEGAEYELIPHLLSNGMFSSYIDRLYIEFHYPKLSNVTEEYHNDLVSKLTKCGIQPKEWDAHRNYLEK